MEYLYRVEATEANGTETLFFNGDIEARFGPEVSSGTTKIRIPLEATHGIFIKSNHSVIYISKERYQQQSFSAKKLTCKKFGDRKALLVRVIGNDGLARGYSAAELCSDFFTDGACLCDNRL